MSESINMGTSFFAGSTRWMAPELIMGLINDDGHIPPITTSSDVYAFASVCFEVILKFGFSQGPTRANVFFSYSHRSLQVNFPTPIGPMTMLLQ